MIYSIHNGISPMPISRKVKRRLLGVLSQRGIHGKVFELGAGWGSLAFPLAQKLPRCPVLAYENSLIPYLFSRCRKLLFPYENLTLNRGNFYHISLAEADIVVCYLYPGAMVRLQAKFERELKRETLVISSTFAVPAWKPRQIIEVDDLYHTKIYVYIAQQH